MMCFDKDAVKDLITKIENEHIMPFYQAAIKLEQSNEARFSEYELYGVFLILNGVTVYPVI